MAKSDYKVVFEDDDRMNDFVHILYACLSSYKEWMKNCDYFARKNVLYVKTARYTCVDNFVQNFAWLYGGKVVKL